MSTRWFPDAMPQPMAGKEALPFWQAAAEHRLVAQKCGDCSHLHLPPSPICPSCRSDVTEWQDLSGRGEVYTYTTIHRAVAPGQDLPFVVAVIALDGAPGVRLISNLVDTPLSEIEIGMSVEVVWEDMGPDLTLPRFKAVPA